MKKQPNIILGLVFIAMLALGGLLGVRVDNLNDADQFYKWLISASTQVRVEGGFVREQDIEDPKDQELFDRIAEIAERELPPLDNVEAALANKPRLIQYASATGTGFELADDEENMVAAIDTDEQRRRLTRLWRFAQSPAVRQERDDFFEYRRNRQLASVGSQFDLEQLYGSEDVVVSMSNMFMGFRQMAANLIWLESDKYWHAGQYYRMVPVMKATVMLDPHFIDAYQVGAWHMTYNFTATMDDTPTELRRYDPEFGARVGDRERWYQMGIDFLKDGIAHNPTNYKLYFDLGFAIYEEKLDDHENAVRYLTEAHRQPHDTWVPRMLYRSMMRNEQYEESIAGYQDYKQRHPDSPVPDRFIAYNRGLIADRDAEKAYERAEEAQEAALEAQYQIQEAMLEGDEQRAREAESRADEYLQLAQQHEAEARAHRDEAIRIWEELTEYEDDPFAEAHLLRNQALELVEEERYVEARALLDYARLQSDDLFFELSDLMIDIKLEEGSELNLSERMALERRRIDEAVQDQEVGDRTFEFRDIPGYDHGWYEPHYRNQEVIAITDTSPEMDQLRRDIENVHEITELAYLNDEHPRVAEVIDLGNHVVFQGPDGQWYRYQRNS